MLTLWHAFESEMLDSIEASEAPRHIERLLEAMVPKVPGFSAQAILLPGANAVPANMNININQQFIQAAEGAIVHNVQGTAHFGAEAKQLLALVRQYAGRDAGELESAVHELEDVDARQANRLNAKQRIKAFLFRIAKNIEGPAMDVLQKYVEAKMGL